MKVLLINGSPRKEGNTYCALSEVAKTLENEGIETEIVWIGNRPMRGCIACGRCKSGEPYPDGHKGCVFNDDQCNAISAKFAEADGFVFGSPVYTVSRTVRCYASCNVPSTATVPLCRTSQQP